MSNRSKAYIKQLAVANAKPSEAKAFDAAQIANKMKNIKNEIAFLMAQNSRGGK